MDLATPVARITGRPVVRVDEIPGAGGYTPALRRIATLEGGMSVFVKAAVNDLTRSWLATERRSYEALDGAPFLPRYFGADGDVLVLEDLRAAHWPPPWRPGDLDLVWSTLEELSRYRPPAGADDLETAGGPMLRRWPGVVEDPAPFLGLGLCSAAWFERAAPVLIAAERAGTLTGDALVHFDFRSDNLCVRVDGRVAVIDWNGTARGRADFDAHCFAQTLAPEGGPEPHVALPDADPSLVAMLTGYFAEHAPRPRIPDAPRVRDIQLAQLRVSLPWAARLLDLPPPA